MIDRALPIDYVDYTNLNKLDKIFTVRSDLTNKQAQWQTGTYARGHYTMEISILIPKCNEIYTRNKDKIRGQK